MSTTVNTGDTQRLLVGVGSFSGDDCIGLCVAKQIGHQSLPGLRIGFADSPIRLLDQVEGAEMLFVCDAWVGEAVDAESEAAEPAMGELRRWTWPDIDIENVRFTGSHDLSLGAALQLADRLGMLPPKVHICGICIGSEAAGISGHHFHPPSVQPARQRDCRDNWDQMLSPAMAKALPGIVERMIGEICDA